MKFILSLIVSIILLYTISIMFIELQDDEIMICNKKKVLSATDGSIIKEYKHKSSFRVVDNEAGRGLVSKFNNDTVSRYDSIILGIYHNDFRGTVQVDRFNKTVTWSWENNFGMKGNPEVYFDCEIESN